jgi:glutathione peroxidase
MFFLQSLPTMGRDALPGGGDRCGHAPAIPSCQPSRALLEQRMNKITTLLALFVVLACNPTPPAMAAPQPAAPSVATIDQSVTDIHGKPFDLKSLRGKAVLVVNVASECGYTPQYAELQQLSERYRDKGLVVIGFPSNDFGGQEPNDGAAILAFASKEYGVTFPLMAKVHATGPEISPVYQQLTTQSGPLNGPVKWNFAKFLLDKTGKPVARFDSNTTPLDAKLLSAIDAAIAG